jgi:hypothetical protein
MRRFLLVFSLAFLFYHSLAPSSSAETIFFEEFNGNGELNSYNNNFKHVDNFPNGQGSGGIMTVSNGKVRATGYDPAYVYTAIPGVDACASIDFNWSQGGNWTGIIFNTSHEATSDKAWSMFSVHGGDQRWFLYRFGTEQMYDSISIDYQNTHTIKLCISNDLVEGFIDNTLIVSAPNVGQTKYFGFASQIGTNDLDNFKIEKDIPVVEIDLDVPLLKQTASPWGAQIYNSANLWNPSDPSIGSWGCAMTSASMVFKYHGINKLPDGRSLDPGTLNTWLKSQKDGFVGNGLVNWIALTRLSKKAKNINNLTYDALEFFRKQTVDKQTIVSDLKNNLPDIVGVPGHFIVAKGTKGNDLLINDPFYNRNLLSEFNDDILSIGTFVPSNTDLSYLLFVTETNVRLEITDSTGKKVAERFSENAIVNPNNPSETNSEFLDLYAIQKPSETNYNILVNSVNNTPYDIKIYSYDKNGEVFTRKLTGEVSIENPARININYSSEDIYTKQVTYVSTLIDIEKGFKLKNYNKTVKRNLEELLARAFLNKVFKNRELELKYLIEFENNLGNNQSIIKEPSYSNLLYDVNYLSSHIQ